MTHSWWQGGKQPERMTRFGTTNRSRTHQPWQAVRAVVLEFHPHYFGCHWPFGWPYILKSQQHWSVWTYMFVSVHCTLTWLGGLVQKRNDRRSRSNLKISQLRRAWTLAWNPNRRDSRHFEYDWGDFESIERWWIVSYTCRWRWRTASAVSIFSRLFHWPCFRRPCVRCYSNVIPGNNPIRYHWGCFSSLMHKDWLLIRAILYFCPKFWTSDYGCLSVHSIVHDTH